MATPIHIKVTNDLVRKHWQPPAVNLGAINQYLEKANKFEYSVDYFAREDVNGCKFVQHDLNVLPLPFESNHFGLVSCFGTIHYVDNAAETLKDIHRILRDDGVFLVSLTNIKWASNIWGLLQSFKMLHTNMVHDQLVDMLKESGFEIVDVIKDDPIKTVFGTKIYYVCTKSK